MAGAQRQVHAELQDPPGSVTPGFIGKTVQRHTPDPACTHWNYCAKEEKKAK